MLKKSIITLIILTIALPIFASNSNYKLETTGSVPPSPILKKIMFLRVGELDSIGGINTVYSYPDEDVDVLYTNRLDSMTNTWFVDNYYGYTPQPGDTLFQFAGRQS